MKQYILLNFLCVMLITTAVNITDYENFYAIDLLLTADEVFNSNINENDTGLSIRLTSYDGIISSWYHLYTYEESNYFGQRRYILPKTTDNFGIISNITIRIDQLELANSSMPYYLCIHGILNNTINEIWNGCTYIQSLIEYKNNTYQQYPLRDVNGKLF